jgi:general secretion pathway protein H
LVVVLLVMAAAASLALPRLEGVLPQLKLKQTAREAVLLLRSAQRLAIRDNREIVVTFDPAGHRLAGPGRDSLAIDRRFRLQLVSGARLGGSRGAGGSGGADEISFFPDGTSTGGRLTLSYRARSYEITVDWELGRAAIGHD